MATRDRLLRRSRRHPVEHNRGTAKALVPREEATTEYPAIHGHADVFTSNGLIGFGSQGESGQRDCRCVLEFPLGSSTSVARSCATSSAGETSDLTSLYGGGQGITHARLYGEGQSARFKIRSENLADLSASCGGVVTPSAIAVASI